MVYCPCSDQLNVRLALAGQAEYKVDTNNPNQVVNEQQGIMETSYKFEYCPVPNKGTWNIS